MRQTDGFTLCKASLVYDNDAKGTDCKKCPTLNVQLKAPAKMLAVVISLMEGPKSGFDTCLEKSENVISFKRKLPFLIFLDPTALIFKSLKLGLLILRGFTSTTF